MTPQEPDPLAEMEARKDAAYFERNQVVAAFAKAAIGLGLRAGRKRTFIEDWSPDWHNCVYIDLPSGQVSWHYHDSHAALFEALPTYVGEWDGHDTPEKYRRLDAFQPPVRCSNCGCLDSLHDPFGCTRCNEGAAACRRGVPNRG